MFPDSSIAINMSLQKTKMAYNILYGIAPFFQKQLTNKINGECNSILIAFDESLNKVAKKSQMDIHVRFWDSSKKSANVTTKYFNSGFLNHASATDLLDSFLVSLKDLKRKKLIQVSMDGPNVNLKF